VYGVGRVTVEEDEDKDKGISNMGCQNRTSLRL
jgi:hypothetical protein